MSEKRPDRKSLNTSTIKNELEETTPTRKVQNANSNESPAQKCKNQDINIELKTPQTVEINTGLAAIRGFNVPEHILIVFDCVKDEIETDFECGDEKINPRQAMARALRMFIQNKIAMNKTHSFSIMALNERNAALLTPQFTKNPQILIDTLQKLMQGCHTEDIFNLNTVFETILAKHNKFIHYDQSPPDVVYRVIFCYGRSFTSPALEETPEITALLEAPNFFFDVVYTHEPPPSKCNEIFKVLRGIDRKDQCYLFSVERNLKAAHKAMAFLLAHPLQRQPWKNVPKFGFESQ